MRKIRYDDCICQIKLIDHSIIKDRILNEIKLSTYYESIGSQSSYETVRVSRADMDLCGDLNRSWVKILMPNLSISINEMLSNMAYNGFEVNNMWYHQYAKEDTYGWHIHGDQFAGIYYVEFGKSSGKTEMCSPYSFKTMKINITEGDVIIFPAHLMHRALPNSDERKTVVSFNFNLKDHNHLNLDLIK